MARSFMISGKAAALTALALNAAHPALAEDGFSCVFTVACDDTRGCDVADIMTEIALAEDGPTVFLSAAPDHISARRLSDEGETPIAFAADIPGVEANLITINADGTASRSHQSADPAQPTVTYFGTCQEI